MHIHSQRYITHTTHKRHIHVHKVTPKTHHTHLHISPPPLPSPHLHSCTQMHATHVVHCYVSPVMTTGTIPLFHPTLPSPLQPSPHQPKHWLLAPTITRSPSSPILSSPTHPERTLPQSHLFIKRRKHFQNWRYKQRSTVTET